MAFNQAMYNRTAFNMSGTGKRWLRAAGVEKVTAALSTAPLIYSIPRGYELVRGSLTGVPGKMVRSVRSEVVGELVTEALRCVFAGKVGAEDVSFVGNAAAVIMPAATPAEAIDAATTYGAEIYPESVQAEAVDAVTTYGAEIYPDAEGGELVIPACSVETLETKECTLAVTLPPGGVLIVDADYYNVTLDGDNAIWTHSGDWIDELSRDTASLEVTAVSGAAGLSASVLYTERFL